MRERSPKKIITDAQKRNHYVLSRMGFTTFGVAMAEKARHYEKVATMGEPRNAIENTIFLNGGDLSLAFFAGYFTYAALGRIRNLSIRKGVSAAVSAATVLLAEVPHFSVHVFGTPDLKDIPAGAAGLLAWWGLTAFNEKKAEERFPPREERTIFPQP